MSANTMRAFSIKSAYIDSLTLVKILESLNGAVNVHATANGYIVIAPVNEAIFAALRPNMEKTRFRTIDYFPTD